MRECLCLSILDPRCLVSDGEQSAEGKEQLISNKHSVFAFMFMKRVPYIYLNSTCAGHVASSQDPLSVAAGMQAEMGGKSNVKKEQCKK